MTLTSMNRTAGPTRLQANPERKSFFSRDQHRTVASSSVCRWSRGLALLAMLAGACPGNAADLTVNISIVDAGIQLEWDSHSLTALAPFYHNTFQPQRSSDLVTWHDTEPSFLGGSSTQPAVHWARQFPTSDQAQFFRVLGTFQQPGANLNGIQLGGADLSGAQLAGANLANANLTGANLTGADLSGALLTDAQLAQASLSGANIDKINLNSVGLQGADLSGTIGSPVFTQVKGAANTPTGLLLPDFPRYPAASEFDHSVPNFAGKGVAKQLAVVTLKPEATVAQINSLLSKYQGSIVSCRPQSPKANQSFLLIRFPTESPSALQSLADALISEPGVAAAIPDIQLSPDNMTLDTAPVGASDSAGNYLTWLWDTYWNPNGGNWGLEWCRVPELWNFGEAIEKAGGPKTPTLVVDGGFPTHTDLDIDVLNPAMPGQHEDHGLHVAGIIGAKYGNQMGIDGVNPFGVLRGYSFDFPTLSSFYQDIITGLTLAPDTKLVNISIGFAWSPHGTPLTPAEQANATRYALQSGAMSYVVAISNPNTLFVCSAGNDYGAVTAANNSPWGAAGLIYNAPNVLVIGSFESDGTMSDFSNPGPHVLAPGGTILSLAPSSGYAVKSGTSMATPFVTGLAGFLWAADPNLTVAEIRNLLLTTGTGAVDAYISLLSIDSLPGRNNEILRGLLDVDDGTPDGVTRIDVPAISDLGDRSFHRIAGTVDNTQFGTPGQGHRGNGKIDMGDFRTWRDWLLNGEESFTLNHSLNGSDANPKVDANQDGEYQADREIKFHPRGDFNGDGVMNRSDTLEMAGSLGTIEYTDLEVLQASGLWEDPIYQVTDLDTLIDSLDLVVSGKSLLIKEPTFPEALVWVRNATTGAKLYQPFRLSRTNDTQIYTVPVGQEYYVATDPIQLADGRVVLARSIGTMKPTAVHRGGDFAVDLTIVEMTVKFATENPQHAELVSDPKAKAVAALITELATSDPTGNPPQAYANDQATLYAWAKSAPFQTAPPDKQADYRADVSWKRSFTKLPGVAFPKYHIKPIHLRLADQDLHPDTNELSAETMILLQRRVGAATNAEWRNIFYARTHIVGHGQDDTTAHTFRIETHEGYFGPPTPTFESDSQGRIYSMTVEFPDVTRQIDLSDIADGASFELRYILQATAKGPLNINNPCDGDCVAEAYVGDPLSYGSGLSMRYGDFGGFFELHGPSFQPNGSLVIPYSSSREFYFTLYRTNLITHTETPIALQRGVDGTGTFIDSTAPAGATLENYRLLAVPLERPVDADGDGLDDLYELDRPQILNPLDPTDASEDADHDGYTNKAEYENGTNPEVPDAPPESDPGFYPAQIQALDFGSSLLLEDVNQDGRRDMVSIHPQTGNILVQLGNPDESFQAGLESARIAEFSSITDMQIGQLDADALPDLVITSLVEQRAYVYQGLGDGRFQFRLELVTGSNPRRVLPMNLNGDASLDLVVLNERSKSVSRYLGNPNGSFSSLGELAVPGTGFLNDLASGDLNQDGKADLAISANANLAVVLLGKANGDFEAAKFFEVDLFPNHVAVGDLNGDGLPDIATTSSTVDSVSVLFGLGQGNFSGQVRLALADNPLKPIIRDLNNDGKGDLVIGHLMSVVTRILGTSGQTLTSPSLISAITGGAPIVVDIDEDQKLDLLTGISGRYSFLKGNGDGSFKAGVVLFQAGKDWSHPGLLTTAGHPPRWAALNHVSNSVEVVELNGLASLRIVQTITLTNNLAGLELKDINGDGIADAIAYTSSFAFGTRVSGTNRVHFMMGQSDGTFAAPTFLALPEAPRSLVVADLNGDGRKDLLFIGGDNFRFLPFLQGVGGTWQPQTASALIGFPSTMLATDLNGDGKEEIVAQGYAEEINILSWNGTSIVAAQTLPNSSSTMKTLLADYDHDGDLDLLTVEYSETESKVKVYPTANGLLGAGTTLLQITDPSRTTVVDMQWADINQDGLLDLLLEDGSMTLQVYLAQQSGGFDEAGFHFMNTSASNQAESKRIFALDLTGDSRTDVLTIGGGEIHVLPHQ
ncbi:MAG: VCBS repeat-containing protein [Verrucomicrobiales bacterium]|nr:VCBS repeat-containing protein [Verrucomicrobiales bacterium]